MSDGTIKVKEILDMDLFENNTLTLLSTKINLSSFPIIRSRGFILQAILILGTLRKL